MTHYLRKVPPPLPDEVEVIRRLAKKEIGRYNRIVANLISTSDKKGAESAINKVKSRFEASKKTKDDYIDYFTALHGINLIFHARYFKPEIDLWLWNSGLGTVFRGADKRRGHNNREDEQNLAIAKMKNLT